MTISPDEVIYFEYGWFHLNATILFTWVVMVILVSGSWFVTRRLRTEGPMAKGQNLLEVLVSGMNKEIRGVSQQEPGDYLPFVGTLFLFIVVSNLYDVIPRFEPPTGSLSTTTALALSVFIAVPIYGVVKSGPIAYLKQYVQPTVIMLPFNLISELSRTLALAVRLYGNIMSGTMIGAILLSIIPLFFPIIMDALGLLTGMIQAYIFAILAMVYISAGTQIKSKNKKEML